MPPWRSQLSESAVTLQGARSYWVEDVHSAKGACDHSDELRRFVLSIAAISSATPASWGSLDLLIALR